MNSIKSFNPKTDIELNELLEKLLVSEIDFNIIINIGDLNLIFFKEIQKLLNLSKKNKKSLIIVSSKLSDEKLNIVPTLSEAYDIIELEEIERDFS